MAAAPPPLHLVIFPYMAQGHTIPLLDISKAFAIRELKVVIITTPSNAPFIVSETSNHPNISLSIIPFPRVPELPEGCENTADLPSMVLLSTFVEAVKQMKQPFEGVLRDMIDDGHPPICVISDFFLSWTLDSCRSFGIPRIVSHGMGVLPLAICNSLTLLPLRTKPYADLDPLELPNLKLPFTLHKADIPESLLDSDPNDPFARILAEFREADINSWGVLVNSLEELEGDHVGAFESFYFNDAKAYCLGLLFLYNKRKQEVEAEKVQMQSYSYIKWLEKQAGSDGNAVIYVSFGTQAHLSDDQLDEIAFGLEMAEHPFIWVVRSRTWAAPEGWKERVKEKGLVLHDWVDQRSILSHPAIGGFLSHCGWNSILESISMGVPLLAWPMLGISDQGLNAKLIVSGWGAGLMMPHRGDGGEKIMTVGRDVICERVNELMGNGKGRKVRERAQALGRMARGAMENGGSSDKKLDQLIDQLINKNGKSSSI
ncbi:UDP-glycosyltransferase 90A2-like [Juglans microcarpa x Juglans regia]|uniref:UDP-glycosyltransferase 90A2-like n=1 Tax=Juglans microcarpa x Juglans regia TaxID=2249226 RepID=UPI001B7EE7BD|nr:UDP-glycosyltransferase 90A2-like [Juglans microcarpa x Juglans regia]